MAQVLFHAIIQDTALCSLQSEKSISSVRQALGGLNAVAITPDMRLAVTVSQQPVLTFWRLGDMPHASIERTMEVSPAHDCEALCVAVRLRRAAHSAGVILAVQLRRAFCFIFAKLGGVGLLYLLLIVCKQRSCAGNLQTSPGCSSVDRLKTNPVILPTTPCLRKTVVRKFLIIFRQNKV